MASEPDSLVLQLLRDMRAKLDAMQTDLSDVREQMATKTDIAALRDELKSSTHSLRADVASDLLVARKEHGEQIVGLRRAVIEYHTSFIGHGVLISELEGRLRRVEQHLNPADG